MGSTDGQPHPQGGFSFLMPQFHPLIPGTFFRSLHEFWFWGPIRDKRLYSVLVAAIGAFPCRLSIPESVVVLLAVAFAGQKAFVPGVESRLGCCSPHPTPTHTQVPRTVPQMQALTLLTACPSRTCVELAPPADKHPPSSVVTTLGCHGAEVSAIESVVRWLN
ncbi:hypothetical protein VTK26DRAFT_3994 [Humicola hyalothermophila]